MPYETIQTLIDPLWGKGIHAYFKATNLARLDDDLIGRLCELHLAAPGPQCEIHVQEWARAVIAMASDASTGRAYVNFLGDTNAARTSYGDETYARLVSLKERYDSTNVFRPNQNVEPSNHFGPNG